MEPNICRHRFLANWSLCLNISHQILFGDHWSPSWAPMGITLASPVFICGTAREEKIIWSARWCTVPLLASPQPPSDNFILRLRGILEYTTSQEAGTVLADEKPVIVHSYLVAEFSAPCENWLKIVFPPFQTLLKCMYKLSNSKFSFKSILCCIKILHINFVTYQFSLL